MATKASTDSQTLVAAAQEAKGDPVKAERLYKLILAKDPGSNDEALSNYETALNGLGKLYRDHK